MTITAITSDWLKYYLEELPNSSAARHGACTICAISLMHTLQGLLVLLNPAALHATGMAAFLDLFDDFNISAVGFVPVLLLFASATLAAYGAVFPHGKYRMLMFMPQHFILGVMVIGACVASYKGSYLDGTPKPTAHILADQLPLLILFTIYTRAVLWRSWDKP